MKGPDHYLGAHVTPASREAYHCVLAKWNRQGGQLPPQTLTPANITVGQLSLEYLRHADAYYRKPDGSPTGEPSQAKRAAHSRRRRRHRPPNDHCTVATFRRAIQRACDRAFELPAALAAMHAEVREWVDKWTHAKKRAPRAKDMPTELREKREALEALRSAHLDRLGIQVTPWAICKALKELKELPATPSEQNRRTATASDERSWRLCRFPY